MTLAIHGGPKTRATRMPPRRAFIDHAKTQVDEAFAYYQERDFDFGYQGHFEELYTRSFIGQLCGGEGYADAVATGTIAVYLAVAALELPKGSEILVSPITDPGTLSAVILNGLTPRLIDSRPDSYNVGLNDVKARMSDKTSAILLVHAAGQVCAEIEEIAAFARERKVALIEDCSQSHAATRSDKSAGTFGDIAAFSTMYRKNHSTGSCGGVVYTRNEALYHKILAYADRGKPSWRDDFEEKDPATFLFPALNLHIDELSCAIGLASLKRLPEVIEGRLNYIDLLRRSLQRSSVCRIYPMTREDSPFFLPVFVDTRGLSCSKQDFAEAVRAEGIDLNPHYMYGVHEWPWVQPYLSDDFDCPNATACRAASFNLLFNENFTEQEAEDTANAIMKVENYYKT